MNARSGFTLLEIMIVVAVIAILALALLPNLLGSRQGVQDSAIETTLQRAMSAQELFHSRCATYYRGSQTTSARCTAAVANAEWARFFPASAEDPNITLTFTSATNLNYCMRASHANDPQRFWYATSSTTQQGRPSLTACS